MRTKLGERLAELRRKIVASGQPLLSPSEGRMNLWYIVNEEGEFWNDEWGWTGFDEATFYPQSTALPPAGGRWEEAQLCKAGTVEKLIHDGVSIALKRRSTEDRLKHFMQLAIEALENVPVVGEVYDQQHSDTHMRATLMLKGALLEA